MGESKDTSGAGGSQRRTRRTTPGAGEGEAAAEESAGEGMGEDARRFTEDVRAAADSLLAEEKQRMAELAEGFANALRRSADAFAEEGSAVVARCADQAAERIEQLSRTVRGQSWREMAAGVEDAARRRPELFLAGAAAAGFILARLVSGIAADATED